MLPKSLHRSSSRPRSKPLGDIDDRRSPKCPAAVLEQTQEPATNAANRSRSACGHLEPISPHEVLSTVEHDEKVDEFHDQGDVSSKYGEVFGEDIENIFATAKPPISDEHGGDEEGENNTCHPSSSQDQDTTSWSHNLWSTSSNPPPTTSTPCIPLPAPNDLTSTYIPFSCHLALTTHFPSSTLSNLLTLHPPIFLHGILQLPATLSQILFLRTSEVLCRLTPAILLHHTTFLSARTLLPALVPVGLFSTYRYVSGLLYFPCNSTDIDKIGDFLAATQNAELEVRNVQTQIRDSEGRRWQIGAWGWVSVNAEGAEQWWTLEEFVAGRIVGIETVEW